MCSWEFVLGSWLLDLLLSEIFGSNAAGQFAEGRGLIYSVEDLIVVE